MTKDEKITVEDEVAKLGAVLRHPAAKGATPDEIAAALAPNDRANERDGGADSGRSR